MVKRGVIQGADGLGRVDRRNRCSLGPEGDDRSAGFAVRSSRVVGSSDVRLRVSRQGSVLCSPYPLDDLRRSACAHQLQDCRPRGKTVGIYNPTRAIAEKCSADKARERNAARDGVRGRVRILLGDPVSVGLIARALSASMADNRARSYSGVPPGRPCRTAEHSRRTAISRGSATTCGPVSGWSRTTNESASTRKSARPSSKRIIATVDWGLLGFVMSQVPRCSRATCSIDSARAMARSSPRSRDRRPSRLAPRRWVYQATPWRQIASVPGIPAPSSSTAAPGTAPTKSSFGLPTWPGLLAIAAFIFKTLSVMRIPAVRALVASAMLCNLACTSIRRAPLMTLAPPRPHLDPGGRPGATALATRRLPEAPGGRLAHVRSSAMCGSIRPCA